MLSKAKKGACLFLASLVLIITICSQSAYAYWLNGYHISSPLYFVPHSGYGETSKQHFNDAMYIWNYWSGHDLMHRLTTTHSSTNFPSNDGNNYIYRVNVGLGYIGLTHYYPTGSIMTSADINLNMFYPWANSQQPGCYDVWTVFLHEAGHAAGLGHSLYQNAVMYPIIPINTEKRDLAQDDKLGIQACYSNVNSNGINTSNNDRETDIMSGVLEQYNLTDLINTSTLIVKAKLTSASDAFQIIPVFGCSPSNFTDYNFKVSEVVFGNATKDDMIVVRMQGGLAGGTDLIVEDNPQFTENEEVLLFLYQPKMGSGYNTKGDYYYILGLGQGAYYQDSRNNSYFDMYGNKLSYDYLVNAVGKRDVNSIDEEHFLKQFVANTYANLKSGFITENEYLSLLSEASQYATIVK
jgi:hypothetical protein